MTTMTIPKTRKAAPAKSRATRTYPAFDPNQQTSLRLDMELLTRADSLTDYLTWANGSASNRSDVLRRALALGIAELERLDAERKRTG